MGAIEALLDQLLSGMTRKNWVAVGIVAVILLAIAGLLMVYSQP